MKLLNKALFVVFFLLSLNLALAQETSLAKYEIQYTMGLASSSDIERNLQLFCGSGPLIHESSDYLYTSNYKLNLYRNINIKHAAFIGLGLDQFHFRDNYIDIFDLSSHRENVTQKIFSASAGHRYIFNTSAKFQFSLETALVLDIESGFRVSRPKALAIQPKLGANYRISPRLMAVGQVFYRTNVHVFDAEETFQLENNIKTIGLQAGINFSL